MNFCAHLAWEAADADLNAAYRIAIAQARDIDRFAADAGIERPTTTEDDLRVAQRAWITFRDAACMAEDELALGGSMAPMLYSLCLEKLTRERTEHLRYFGDVS